MTVLERLRRLRQLQVEQAIAAALETVAEQRRLWPEIPLAALLTLTMPHRSTATRIRLAYRTGIWYPARGLGGNTARYIGVRCRDGAVVTDNGREGKTVEVLPEQFYYLLAGLLDDEVLLYLDASSVLADLRKQAGALNGRRSPELLAYLAAEAKQYGLTLPQGLH